MHFGLFNLKESINSMKKESLETSLLGYERGWGANSQENSAQNIEDTPFYWAKVNGHKERTLTSQINEKRWTLCLAIFQDVSIQFAAFLSWTLSERGKKRRNKRERNEHACS